MKTTNKIKLGVSLYSYQDSYYFGRQDLEGCIAAAAGSGAEGIEVFADAMIDEWPAAKLSDEFLEKWNHWMKQYGITPVCLDHFSDRAMWHNRQLTDDELFDRSVLYIKTAAQLGCHTIRLLHDEHIGDFGISPYRLTDVHLVERLLPVAQEYDVMMALECHNPTNVAQKCQEKYLELADRTGIPYVGLQADFSSYEYCISTADIGNEVRNSGANREVLEALREIQRDCYFKKQPFLIEEYRDTLNKLGATENDWKIMDFFIRLENPYGSDKTFSYETLKEYASRLVYIHGKFYEFDENGQVDNMDYPAIFTALKEGGYQGFISSEFEGNRRMNDDHWVDDIDYVRRHQALMRECLE